MLIQLLLLLNFFWRTTFNECIYKDLTINPYQYVESLEKVVCFRWCYTCLTKTKKYSKPRLRNQVSNDDQRISTECQLTKADFLAKKVQNKDILFFLLKTIKYLNKKTYEIRNGLTIFILNIIKEIVFLMG